MPRKTQIKKTEARRTRKSKSAQRGMPTLNQNEQNLVKGLRDVHLMTAGMMRKNYGLTQHAIDQLYKSKVLNKVTEIHANGKKSQAFELGTKGEKFVRQQLGLNHLYKSNSFEHDLKLAKFYLKSLNQEERNSWKTEAQKRDELHDKRDRLDEIRQDMSRSREERDQADEAYNRIIEMIHNETISSVDGTYVRDGVEISLEIIGKYSDAQVQAKENFCTEMNITWNYIR